MLQQCYVVALLFVAVVLVWQVDRVCEPLVGNFHSVMQDEADDAIVQGLDCIMDGAGEGNKLARQLDFDNESLPFDCRKHVKSGCSWRNDNSTGSIQGIMGSDNGYHCIRRDSPEVTGYSPPVVHTRPTPTPAHKVTMVWQLLSELPRKTYFAHQHMIHILLGYH